MRFISRCYIALGRYDEALMWLDKAIKEAPYLRDGYVEKMLLEYKLNNYNEVIKLGKKALKIKYNNMTYINETFTFDETIYDLMSLSYYFIGNKEEGKKYINKALKINPNNERIVENKKFFD